MFRRGNCCKYDFYKEECQSFDFGRFDEFMAFLENNAKDARQNVLLMTHDYDDDQRLLFLIPEVASYIRALLKKYPFFWYYAIPTASEYLLFCLLQINMINFTGDPKKDSDLFDANINPDHLMNLLKVMAVNLDIYGREIKDIQGSIHSFKVWSEYIMGITRFGPPKDGMIFKM